MTTGPRPGSSWDSITVPEAGASGLAPSSSSSVTSRIMSSRLSRPSWVLAETSQKTVSPPHSSGVRPSAGQLGADPFGVGALFVDLVDGDQDRHVGGAGVVDRLFGLRHDAVVGGDDDHGDVGDLGAAGAHRREGGVAGGVEEGDRLLVVVHLVGADVLGDATGLAGGDLGLADRVQQRGLAVVDVAHDRHHRRAVGEVLVGVVELRLLGLLLGGGDDLDLAVVLVGDRPHRLVGEGLGERRHLAHHHQLLDHLGRGRGRAVSASSRTVAPELTLVATGSPGRVRLRRRLLEQRPAAASTAAARRALRRRAAHLVAAGGLRVDHDAAFFRTAPAPPPAPLAAGATGLRRGLAALRQRRQPAFAAAGVFAGALAAAASVGAGAGFGFGLLAEPASAPRASRPWPPLPLAAAIAFTRVGLLDARRGGLRLDAGGFQRSQQFLAADALRLRDLVNPLLSH